MTASPNNAVVISRRTISAALTMIAIVVFIIAATMFLYARAAISEMKEPFVLPVNTSTVNKQQHYTVHEYYSGRVEAQRTVDLSFEQPGKIDTVYVDEGAAVQQGDILAAQDTMILKANREQAAASVGRTKAQLELAQLTEERRKQLFEQGHVNEQQYDEARLNTKTIEAQLKEAEAVLNSIDVNIEKSVLRAPFAGTIGRRFFDDGGVVNAGTPILNLLERGAQLVRVSMPTDRVSALSRDQATQIVYRDTEILTSIYAVRTDVNPQTRTQDVLFKISPEISITTGELVELKTSSIRNKAGYWMPTEALVEGTRGLWNVFELISNGSEHAVQRRSVEIIHAETSRVYVSANLGDQVQIITNGTHRIVPGQKVLPTQNEVH